MEGKHVTAENSAKDTSVTGAGGGKARIQEPSLKWNRKLGGNNKTFIAAQIEYTGNILQIELQYSFVIVYFSFLLEFHEKFYV